MLLIDHASLQKAASTSEQAAKVAAEAAEAQSRELMATLVCVTQYTTLYLKHKLVASELCICVYDNAGSRVSRQ